MKLPSEFTNEKDFQKACAVCLSYRGTEPELYQAMLDLLNAENDEDPVREKSIYLTYLKRGDRRINNVVNYSRTLTEHELNFK
jgi:hypothetical protein